MRGSISCRRDNQKWGWCARACPRSPLGKHDAFDNGHVQEREGLRKVASKDLHAMPMARLSPAPRVAGCRRLVLPLTVTLVSPACHVEKPHKVTRPPRGASTLTGVPSPACREGRHRVASDTEHVQLKAAHTRWLFWRFCWGLPVVPGDAGLLKALSSLGGSRGSTSVGCL